MPKPLFSFIIIVIVTSTSEQNFCYPYSAYHVLNMYVNSLIEYLQHFTTDESVFTIFMLGVVECRLQNILYISTVGFEFYRCMHWRSTELYKFFNKLPRDFQQIDCVVLKQFFKAGELMLIHWNLIRLPTPFSFSMLWPIAIDIV